MLPVRTRRVALYVVLNAAVWTGFGALGVFKLLYLPPRAADVHQQIEAFVLDVGGWATVAPIALFAGIGLLRAGANLTRGCLIGVLLLSPLLALVVQTGLASKAGLSSSAVDGSSASIGYLNHVFPLLAIGAATAVMQVRRRVEAQRLQAAELRDEVSRGALRQLRADLEPHFLFNALNVVAGLLPNNPAAAEAMVRHLSELLERSVRWQSADEIPLAEEVGFVRRYLEIQKIRFRDRLSMSIEMDPSLEQLLVPPLILQPLVENAVRHGIAKLEEGGLVEVRVTSREGQLFMEVHDTGPGFVPNADTERGFGIANVRARLRLSFGSSQALTFGAVRGRFVATIVLPAKWRTA